MAASAELKGLKEVREGLAEFSRTIARNVGRRALLVPANIIGDRAQANAPVSTRPFNKTPGSLKASKEVKPAKTERRSIATVAIIFRDEAAVPTEYGLTTRDYPAQAWFRSAIDATIGQAEASFGRALTEEVEKAAARAAKKSKATGT